MTAFRPGSGIFRSLRLRDQPAAAGPRRLAWTVFGLAALALPLSTAAPAAAQNATGQIMTPFSTPTSPAPFAGPGSGGAGTGGGHHDGHGGAGHHHDFPFVVFPFWGGSFDDGGTSSVQINPVNTAPFAPPAPPAAKDRAPAQPYKAPSVEIAPGGIEIVRGPG